VELIYIRGTFNNQRLLINIISDYIVAILSRLSAEKNNKTRCQSFVRWSGATLHVVPTAARSGPMNSRVAAV